MLLGSVISSLKFKSMFLNKSIRIDKLCIGQQKYIPYFASYSDLHSIRLNSCNILVACMFQMPYQPLVF